MEKYPLNPWAFIVIFIGLVMVSSLEEMALSPLARDIVLYVPGLALLLQYVWSWQAVRFVSTTFEPATKFRKRFEFLLKLSAVGAGIVVIGNIFKGQPNANAPDTASIIIMIFGMGVVAVAFSVFWAAAAALCMAEDGTEAPPSRIVGTFLLFLYLIIGAPFLYRRLENLDLARSQTARANFAGRPIQ